MQEVLSQSEIDSLLMALNTGDIPAEEVSVPETVAKNYDFRRPNKFSKEHLRTLEMLHQHYSRHLSSFLSGYLSTNANVELASVGQVIYDEFIRSIPVPTALAIFELEPLNGPCILEANTSFIFPVIDLLFGGSGTAVDIGRDLTDIEIQVSRTIMEKMLEYLVPTWQDIQDFNLILRSIETNPRLQQFYSPNDVVVLLTFVVTIGDNDQGMFNLCLPFLALDPIMPKLSVRQQFVRQFTAGTARDHENIIHWLKQCEVDITSIIGNAKITVNDFLQIQMGDVLVLDKEVHSDLHVFVGDKLKFGAQAGQVDGNLAVQIVSLIEGEDDNDGGENT